MLLLGSATVSEWNSHSDSTIVRSTETGFSK
jgi:hypothetical protein